MPTAIVTSDWHADVFSAGLNRYDDVERSALQVVDAAKHADLFLFLGDLSDPDNVRSHRASALACRIAQMLAAMNVPNIWLTGNHDVIEDGQGTHTLSALKAMNPKWTTVIDGPARGCIANVGMVYVVGLPFVARTHAYDADAHVREAKQDYDDHGKGRPVLVLSHLTVPGIEPGSESSSMARGREHLFPTEAVAECFPDALVLQGHYHKAQSWESPHGVTFHVPGSLERLRADEEGNESGFIEVSWRV